MNAQMKLVKAMMTNQTPGDVTMDVVDLWSLEAALQVAARHPGIHDATVGMFTSIGNKLKTAIIQRYPDAEQVIDADSYTEDKEAIMGNILEDGARVQITLTIAEAWMTVSAVQLVLRHPDIHMKMRIQLEHIARQFHPVIAEVSVEAERLLEMGWHPEYDVE
jgi:hypothetical protein